MAWRGDARLTGSVSAGNYDNAGYDDDWTEIVKRRENGDWDLGSGEAAAFAGACRISQSPPPRAARRPP